MYKYQVFPVEGETQVIMQDNPATLEQLQEWVGGYIEAAAFLDADEKEFGDSVVAIVVNEEGLLDKLPINAHWPQYVGPVVIGYLD